MKVFFIGAGPGAQDLITVRGAKILERVPLVMYAGSLVPPEVLRYCKPGAEVVDTAKLDLDQQEEYYRRAQAADLDVARVHSGDPAIYGATAEQMRRLEKLGIPYEVVPGVSSFTAAAASLCSELTKPGVSQTVILTRVSGRASPVPEREALGKLAKSGATLCIFLSGPHLKRILADLSPHYPPDTPVALVHRASWPDERSHRSTLGRLLREVKAKEWRLTTLLLVGRVLSSEEAAESRLYAKDYPHIFRKAQRRKGSQAAAGRGEVPAEGRSVAAERQPAAGRGAASARGAASERGPASERGTASARGAAAAREPASGREPAARREPTLGRALRAVRGRR